MTQVWLCPTVFHGLKPSFTFAIHNGLSLHWSTRTEIDASRIIQSFLRTLGAHLAGQWPGLSACVFVSKSLRLVEELGYARASEG